MRVPAAALLLVGACGRVAFDPSGSDATSAAQRFCDTAPPAYFCSDFDETPDGFSAWSRSVFDFGSVALDTTNMKSEPRSMLITTAGAAADTHAFQESGPLALVPRARLSFDVRVLDDDASEPVLAGIVFDDGMYQHEIEYVYRRPPNASYVEEYVLLQGQQQSYMSYALATQAAPNPEWQRISLDVQTGPTPRVVTALDGAVTLDTALQGTTGGTPIVRVGIVYVASGAAPWRIAFDNVLVE